MRILIFKSEYEKRLFSLYVALDRYFQGRKNISTVTSDTGYTDLTCNVRPLLFKSFSAMCKCYNSVTKMIETDTDAAESSIYKGYKCNVFEFEREDYLFKL